MLRKTFLILGVGLVASIGLLAADFWAAKPFTEWSDKDLQKMLSNSPWAHAVPISMGGRGAGTGGRGGRGGSNGMGEVSSAGGGESIGGAGAANRRGAVSGDEGTPGSGNTPAVNVLVRWQSALPVKQAILKGKYSIEAASSEEAKKFLAQEEPFYVIMVHNPVPGGRGGGGAGVDGAKEMIKSATTLRRKGKDPMYPEKVEIVPRQGGLDIFLMFPKKDAITEDDKDVEFVFQTQMGEVKQRFKLKEMMFDGKLAL